jgi:hypothetical protein
MSYENYAVPQKPCKKCKKPLRHDNQLVQELRFYIKDGGLHQQYGDYYHLRCLESRWTRLKNWIKDTLGI